MSSGKGSKRPVNPFRSRRRHVTDRERIGTRCGLGCRLACQRKSLAQTTVNQSVRATRTLCFTIKRTGRMTW